MQSSISQAASNNVVDNSNITESKTADKPLAEKEAELENKSKSASLVVTNLSGVGMIGS